jgi:hypothetical protein
VGGGEGQCDVWVSGERAWNEEAGVGREEGSGEEYGTVWWGDKGSRRERDENCKSVGGRGLLGTVLSGRNPGGRGNWDPPLQALNPGTKGNAGGRPPGVNSGHTEIPDRTSFQGRTFFQKGKITTPPVAAGHRDFSGAKTPAKGPASGPALTGIFRCQGTRQGPALTGIFRCQGTRQGPALTGTFPVPREDPLPHRKIPVAERTRPLYGNFPVAPGSTPSGGEGRDLAARARALPLLSTPPVADSAQGIGRGFG